MRNLSSVLPKVCCCDTARRSDAGRAVGHRAGNAGGMSGAVASEAKAGAASLQHKGLKRAGAGGGPKSRAPRWNIPPTALTTLEDVFRANHFPSVEARDKLAALLDVKPRQIQVWFQNRRQRERNQQRDVLRNSEDISDALLGFCSGDEDEEGNEDEEHALGLSLGYDAGAAGSHAAGGMHSGAALGAFGFKDDGRRCGAAGEDEGEEDEEMGMADGLDRLGEGEVPFRRRTRSNGLHLPRFNFGDSGGLGGLGGGLGSGAFAEAEGQDAVACGDGLRGTSDDVGCLAVAADGTDSAAPVFFAMHTPATSAHDAAGTAATDGAASALGGGGAGGVSGVVAAYGSPEPRERYAQRMGARIFSRNASTDSLLIGAPIAGAGLCLPASAAGAAAAGAAAAASVGQRRPTAETTTAYNDSGSALTLGSRRATAASGSCFVPSPVSRGASGGGFGGGGSGGGLTLSRDMSFGGASGGGGCFGPTSAEASAGAIGAPSGAGSPEGSHFCPSPDFFGGGCSTLPFVSAAAAAAAALAGTASGCGSPSDGGVTAGGEGDDEAIDPRTLPPTSSYWINYWEQFRAGMARWAAAAAAAGVDGCGDDIDFGVLGAGLGAGLDGGEAAAGALGFGWPGLHQADGCIGLPPPPPAALAAAFAAARCHAAGAGEALASGADANSDEPGTSSADGVGGGLARAHGAPASDAPDEHWARMVAAHQAQQQLLGTPER